MTREVFEINRTWGIFKTEHLPCQLLMLHDIIGVVGLHHMAYVHTNGVYRYIIILYLDLDITNEVYRYIILGFRG